MELNFEKSLYALFAVISDPKIVLSESENQCLNEIGEQIAANSDAWDMYIAPRLQSLLESNSALQSSFQTYLSQLTAYEGSPDPDWLPSDADLDAVSSKPAELVSRGFLPGSVDNVKDSQEINNVAVRILTTPQPAETAKKLDVLKRLKNGLRQSLG